jgi:hypothetical protein
VSTRTCAPALIVVLAVVGGCGDSDRDPAASAPSSAASERSEPAGLPPLEGRLMFSRFDESSHSFLSTHTVAVDGSDETDLPLPGPEGGGRWSRSGQEIAVMTELPDGRIGTAIIDPTGRVERVLDIPDPTLNLVCTVWSRDDARLACEGFDDAHPGRTGIYAVNAADGGDLVRLTHPPEGSADLPGDFSPDGSDLVFERSGGDEVGTLMTVPVAGGEPHLLYEGPVEDPGRYAPDGETILTAGEGALLQLSPSGELVRRIEEPGHVLFGAVWSPDGSHIAYSDATGGPYADVYVSLPDGTERRQVTATPDNEIRVEWGATP